MLLPCLHAFTVCIEATSKRVRILGGVDAVLRCCRSTDLDTRRLAVRALINLSVVAGNQVAIAQVRGLAVLSPHFSQVSGTAVARRYASRV